MNPKKKKKKKSVLFYLISFSRIVTIDSMLSNKKEIVLKLKPNDYENKILNKPFNFI